MMNIDATAQVLNHLTDIIAVGSHYGNQFSNFYLFILVRISELIVSLCHFYHKSLKNCTSQ